MNKSYCDKSLENNEWHSKLGIFGFAPSPEERTLIETETLKTVEG